MESAPDLDGLTPSRLIEFLNTNIVTMKSESVVIIGYVIEKKSRSSQIRTNFFFFKSAGIIGLNVALVLAEQGYASQTTIIAEHLPGDTYINYTSPW